MIIVEGPDGAGKSTLVEWICTEFNLPEGERRTFDRDEIYKTTRHDSFRALHAMLVADEGPQVWDRIGFISDPIYAPLMGRKVVFTRQEVEQFFEARRLLRFPLIICLPPFEVVKANVEGTHQIEAAKSNIKDIYNKYYRLPWGLRYDYTVDGYTLVRNNIKRYLDQRKEREALCS